MRRRFDPAHYVILALLAIGLVSWFLADPGWNLIPLLVFGGVFLLYKYPPNGMRRGQVRMSRSTAQKTAPKRKNAQFRVIPGSKSRTDDEEPPKYH